MAQRRCGPVEGATYRVEGLAGSYLQAVSEHWLMVAPWANPAMLEMFRDRDDPPYRDLVPWAGEFAGKYLTAAAEVLRLTGAAALRARVATFVEALLACQAPDGYLGPWPRGYALTGRAPQYPEGGTWDAWGHYHIMLGLLAWHAVSGDAGALSGAVRIGDLLCARFLGQRQPRLVETGATEMNLAPIHALCLLYRRTGTPEYLTLARQIATEFAARDASGAPLAGDYLAAALARTEFFAMPKPRWESLHPVMGLAELADLTDEKDYRTAFEHIWWSIARLDRHTTGGFSSGEQAQGNPYHPAAIETCCTIAWIALSVEMLWLSADPIVADELELSTFNAVLGAHSPTGRWATYNTPMDGERRASAQDIVFQARAGSPELNCCSVNAARGLGLIADWALVRTLDGAGLLLNWYGPGVLEGHLDCAGRVQLVQETGYPREGAITLRVHPERRAEFTLGLRIPQWSATTSLRVNGQVVGGVQAGTYHRLRREWAAGDMVEITLDMTPHFWVGQREQVGRTAIYRGPLLLAYDTRYNPGRDSGATDAPGNLPSLDARRLALRPVTWQEGWASPFLLLEGLTEEGQPVRLCDFASAGMTGTTYRTWLPVQHVQETPFSRSTPLRSGRPGLS